MGRLEGKVVCITGAARGQGRSHAVRCAEEGADIVAIDICGPVETVMYPGATTADLEDTARLVGRTGRRVVSKVADVRDRDALDHAMSEGADELGGLDAVIANAGIFVRSTAIDMSPEMWQVMIDVNLTGAWHTCSSAIRLMRRYGSRGSIVVISSGAALKGSANAVHYTAAKNAVVGLAKSLAIEVEADGIRINTVHPTSVPTVMVDNESTYALFRPDLAMPTRDDALDRFASLNLMPVPWVEASDVANAVLWLISDEARSVTGIALPVDAGLAIK